MSVLQKTSQLIDPMITICRQDILSVLEIESQHLGGDFRRGQGSLGRLL